MIEKFRSLAAWKFSSLDDFNGSGFTLAEVLITLGVIGVVAAIIMPMLIVNINEKINTERHVNIVRKITQATDLMKAHGKLSIYNSTEDFVDELQKYLKIAKRCDKDHIADCWPTSKITTSDGTEIEVSNIKKGEDLSLISETNNVGLVLADGASIILNYDDTTIGLDVDTPLVASNQSLPVGGGIKIEFPYTTNSTSAIDFIMDVNGKKGPNSEIIDNKYYDIRSFKFAKFANGCTANIDGMGCVVNIGTSYEPLDCTEIDSFNVDFCGSQPSGLSQDYWAGAKLACAKMNLELPSANNFVAMDSVKDKYPAIAALTGIYWTSSEIDNMYSWAQKLHVTLDDMPRITLKSANIPVICVGQ